MKWWELCWLSDDEDLRKVLSEPPWQKFRQWLDNEEAIVAAQRREILDSIVPDGLCLAALEKCRWCFGVVNGQLGWGEGSDHWPPGTRVFSAVEAYRRYGGSVLVTVFDKIVLIDDESPQDGLAPAP
jgi:hypothetical protein